MGWDWVLRDVGIAAFVCVLATSYVARARVRVMPRARQHCEQDHQLKSGVMSHQLAENQCIGPGAPQASVFTAGWTHGLVDMLGHSVSLAMLKIRRIMAQMPSTKPRHSSTPSLNSNGAIKAGKSSHTPEANHGPAASGNASQQVASFPGGVPTAKPQMGHSVTNKNCS